MRKWKIIVVLKGQWVETVIEAQDQWRAWALAKALHGAANVRNVIEIR